MGNKARLLSMFLLSFTVVLFLASLIILSSFQNPIFRFEYTTFQYNLRILIPENFNFFTLDPHTKILQIYEFDAKKKRYIPYRYFPLANRTNSFGLNRRPRIIQLELQKIISQKGIKQKRKHKEGTPIIQSINASKDIAAINAEPYYSAFLSGTYIISIQDVVPYEWRHLITQQEMPGYFFKVHFQ